MTIQKVSPDDIETFTIVTNPAREFSSSSLGVTGSVYVFARHSPSEKETRPLPAFIDSVKNDADLDARLLNVQMLAKKTYNIASGVVDYMSGVRAQQESVRKYKTLEIHRIIPGDVFSDDTLRKLTIKDILMPYYRTIAPSYNYAVTNYQSLNFFTASSVTTGSVVMFPSLTDERLTVHASGCYMPTGAVSFDFYINPRYTTDVPAGTLFVSQSISASITSSFTLRHPGSHFKAGTLFHLSSAYVVSLVTGSSVDPNGFPDGFRILLQLSHSADIKPSLALPGTYPNNLVFMSDDNSLRRNNWHHVVVRWGTSAVDAGTGSFVVDGVVKGTFCVPSASIAPAPFVNNSNSDVLCVGNYYNGPNAGVSSQVLFFALDPATREGLTVGMNQTGIETPFVYQFDHPLNAEVHDLLIREGYATNDDIVSGSGKGPTDLGDALFYWPPFFTQESPTRKFVGTQGGVLQTPFFAVDGTTEDPFNIGLSFAVGAHYVNLENFGRDIVTGQYPLWWESTFHEITGTTDAETANDFLYENPYVRRRNVSVLPCDDGNFLPNYDLVPRITTASLKYLDGVGAPDYSLINLDNLIPSSSIQTTLSVDSGSLFQSLAGPDPTNYGLEPGETLTIFQRTRDPSSNEIVMFDISNLFYGNRILPGSFEITDTSITGTDGKVSITLRDDGIGNLYRADCLTSASTWNSVGNIFYNEGMVLIKTPLVPFFGLEQFEISFKGEQNIHAMRLNVIVPANTLNSSSNPAFQLLSASVAPNVEDQQFVYITGLNFHDQNLNVVMKTQLAQPVLKRTGDRFLFKVKTDF